MEESGGSNNDVNEPVTNEYLLKVFEEIKNLLVS